MSNPEPARQRARALLKEGRVDAAARLLFEAGLVEDAATALADAGRVEDALAVLCGRGRIEVARVDASSLPLAAKLLDGLGRFTEAAEVYARLGQDSAHDEMLAKSGRPSTPAARPRLSSLPDGTEPLAHASALERQGKRAEALRALYRIQPDHPSYRAASHRAIDIAVAQNTVDFDFDHFLSRFLRDPVASDADVEPLLQVAELYERHGFVENAREAIGRVATAVPNHPAVRQAMSRLDRAQRGDSQAIRRAVHEDDGFRKVGREVPAPSTSASSESFPSLPELPPMPARPNRPAPSREPVSRSAPETQGEAPPPFRSPERHRSTQPSNRPEPSPTVQREEREATVERVSTRPPAKADKALTSVFDVPPGFVIGGRYTVERRLGRGGMAAVYKVRDLELDQDLALKLFAPTGNDDSLIGRFKQELVVARQLAHVNIVRLFDLGSHGHASFITMELLDGADLAQVIDERREMIRDLGYVVQALEGLQYAHERGIVHRDLKPENLFVTKAEVVKVMDFGIAKQRTSNNLTQAGFSAGTPAYMSPEQVNDFRSATHLSDLYSMGVLAYRLFTGVLPFDSESPMAILMKQLRETPAPPSGHEPNIPDELEFIILQLLEKDPGRRVQSCRELSDDLKDLRTRLQNRKRRR